MIERFSRAAILRKTLRGGFFARMAGAAKTLPSAMGKHLEAMNNIDLKLKTLALQASEKDQDQVVAANTKLLDQKRAVFKIGRAHV